MNIFTLMGTVLIDNDKANQSISKTGSEADNMSTKIGNGLKKVAQVGAIIATATIAGATALGTLAVKSAATADRIDKLSQKIGMSREAFQQWDFIASQSGMSVEQLQGGFKTLTNQIDSAMKGGKEATSAFDKLGISTKDLTTLSREEIFEKAVTALQGMTNETDKATLANKIFGKSGSELMPLLNGATGSIDEMKKKAAELGLVMSDDAIDAGVKLTDTIDQMKRSFSAMGAQIGAQVMPVIQGFLDTVIENMPTIRKVAGAVFDAISTVLGAIIDNLDILIPILSAVVAGFVAFKVITAVVAIMGAFQAIIGTASTATAIFNAILLANPIGLIAIAIAIVIGLIVALVMNWDKVSEALGKAWVVIKEFAGNMWKAIKDAFVGIWKTIVKFWKDTVDWFKSIPKSMVEFGKNIITGLWDGIKSVFKKVSDWISEKVEWVKDKLMFWKKSESEMSKDNVKSGSSTNRAVNGSHAKGLAYVPFDGYVAEVHEGEEILNKEDATEHRNGGGSNMNETNNLLRNLIGEFSAMKQAYKDQPREMQRISREGVVY